jgi:hypothetical protein
MGDYFDRGGDHVWDTGGDLFSLMAKAAKLQQDAIADGAKMCVTLNPTAHEWALEMERRGLLRRREGGLFHMNDMFELYMRQKNG